MLRVPFHRQLRALDCEAASLQMALAYRGRPVSQDAILGEIGVDGIHPRVGTSGGASGDPFISFVGDPNGSEVRGTGYGTYFPTIARVAGMNGLGVVAGGQGMAPSAVYAFIRSGHPVIAWINFNWRLVPRSYYTAYDGRLVIYAGPGEHTVVVSGVSAGSVLVNDPDRGRYWVSKSRFQRAFATYGDMAVVTG